ncbi:MAG: hypothetical protein AAF226_12250 [Verrucomicrobiota bacterium]
MSRRFYIIAAAILIIGFGLLAVTNHYYGKLQRAMEEQRGD